MSKPDRFKMVIGVYLVLRRGDEVLLLRRFNTGYEDGNYSVVAGHLDGDELASEAVAREAKEEAGITIDPKKLRLVHTEHRARRDDPGRERIELFFEATEWTGDITNCEPEKCDDLSWHPVNNLPSNTIPYIRLTLTDIANGSIYSEYETK
jgi:8-oxo-dGTP diphosphatase